MRYFFQIGYKGTNYRGWQRQPNVLSVQEKLETEINRILKINTFIVGCGRTDAGVHAGEFYFHLDVEKKWDFDLKYRLNKILPPDIVIYEIFRVADTAHAQFDATARTYRYLMHTFKAPFMNDISAWYDEKLDFEKMKIAVALLPKYDDFHAFCKTPDKHNHTICNVMSARLVVGENKKNIQFEITANRFLRGMVRIIVDRLIEVGTGRWTVEKFEYHLSTKERPQFTNFAHPQGLYCSYPQN